MLLMVVTLNAFNDDDIDGVANSQDLCPNTSFDDIVDEDGCPQNQNDRGEITLILGSNFNHDVVTTTDYTFFTNYHTHAWDFSIYSSQQEILDSNNNTSQSAGDLYLSTGYSINQEKLYSKLTLGTKLATGSSEISTQERDYFATLSLSYLIKPKIALLSSLSYTLTGDSSETSYRNSLGYTLGVGSDINEQWYSSLSYQNSTSIYENSENFQALSWYNSYNFSKHFFGTLTYGRGFDNLSYKQTISVGLGVTFE